VEKLAIFLPTLCGGGAERVMVNLACGFVRHGLRVDMVLGQAEGPHLKDVPSTARVVDLKAKRVLCSLPRLVRYLKRERPDAVLSAMSHANIVVLQARSLARVKTRVVVSERSTLSMAVANSPSLRGRLIPLLVRHFYPRADVIVAVSRGVADDLVAVTGLPREKVKVIYNPVETTVLLAKATEPLDHPWFCHGEPPVIVSVGRLTKAKDFPVLIRAFALVRRKKPAHLVILGEGEERSQLESVIKDLGLEKDVTMPGFVTNPYKYIKNARVLVLSSRWEGLPNALIEALVLGTPVVSTDCPSGPTEILEGGKWGKLVPVGDPEALARGILETLDSPPKSEDLQERAKAFSVEAILPQYLEVLGIKEAE